jgi:hypothetical protein
MEPITLQSPAVTQNVSIARAYKAVDLAIKELDFLLDVEADATVTYNNVIPQDVLGELTMRRHSMALLKVQLAGYLR